ncbi:hypothetical protein Taro_047601 [Colocasia esculenta]|uniref:DNA-3-methyladenine glycosylase I n=1 Tax=Colocasia esculenta TaxID=4460 RepID=A0A843X1B3_COLES|nr:hypothetical protein [Colocasia esculenta]
MSTHTVRRHAERSPTFFPEKMENPSRSSPTKDTKHLHNYKVYPPGIQRSDSSLSLSPLSLSQNSNDSSFNGSISSWDRKISLSFLGILGSFGRGDAAAAGGSGKGRPGCGEFEPGERTEPTEELFEDDGNPALGDAEPGALKRCNWITKSSEEHYISFHDECWGVPVYDDNCLFELFALSGMLIDHNWGEITKKRELYREAFSKFDPAEVAKMEEKDIMELSSNKELMLAEIRARCIVENARCILKAKLTPICMHGAGLQVVKEFGSFSGYIWGQVSHRPVINRYKHPKQIPLRTPKSEAISKDMVRRGFRLAGPVIVYSFMQVAGMAVDHLLHCFRFRHCARLAQQTPPCTGMTAATAASIAA